MGGGTAAAGTELGDRRMAGGEWRVQYNVAERCQSQPTAGRPGPCQHWAAVIPNNLPAT